MTSVAYPAQPRLPGWGHTAISLIVGWLLGALGSGALYGMAAIVGAIHAPYRTHAGVLNEWPYRGDGLWTLLTNFAVIMIVLLLTTLATSTLLRRKHDRVSDGRLAAVLFFTGWIPLATRGPAGGAFGFLLALVLIRYWAANHDGHLAIADAVVLIGILGAVALSYGLLHPLWTTEVLTTRSGHSKQTATVVIHNAARVGVTINRLEPMPGFGPLRPSRLHIASGADGVLMFSLPRGGCGSGVFGIHARYHLLGLGLSESLPVRVSFGRC